MKILFLEPFYGGSHKAFTDGLIDTINFDWTLLTLPAIKWKWRMRHSAISFAEKVNNLIANGKNWDMIFCSDMLNLAEFYGLVNKQIRNIPSIIYFHEIQFSYPVQNESERDYHPLTRRAAAQARLYTASNEDFLSKA